MNDYQKRDELLKQMGFGSYEDYLKSDLWNWIRSNFYEQHKGREAWCCPICMRRSGLVLHHTSYDLDVLCGTNPKLQPICPEHHEAIEFDDDGRKRSLFEANDELYRLIGER